MTKFWIEDISYLFHSFYIIPTNQMGIEEQMNCMTRIVLLIFLLMLFANVSYDVLFLAISLLIIIGTFYLVKSYGDKENFVEHYGKVETVLEPAPRVPQYSYTNEFDFAPLVGEPRQYTTPVLNQYPPLPININDNNIQIVDPQTTLAWKDKQIPIENNFGENQRLVGPPNPRTLVQPIIPNPIFDFEVWQPNDFIIPQGINDQKRQEFWQNGYVTQPCPTTSAPKVTELYAKQNFEPELVPQRPNPKYHQQEFQGYRNFQRPIENRNFQRRPMEERQIQNRRPVEIRENYNYGETNPESYTGYQVKQAYYNQDGYNDSPFPSVNKSCGYNPSQTKYNLPVNYQAAACQKTDEMSEYNRNLFSIPLQPGIYTQSQVNQPYASMSNSGISFDQPFLPTTFKKDQNGTYKFTENDPSLVEPCAPEPYHSQNFGLPLRNEIYDPRLTGYGTSYRSFVEPVTGQPRFYYDDIDQQTQPNYISRNNLDIYGGFSHVGTAHQKNLEGDSLREYANKNYVDNQLQFRTELQQRLMHKNSNREWQQRMAPISTTARQTTGGGTMSGFYK